MTFKLASPKTSQTIDIVVAAKANLKAILACEAGDIRDHLTLGVELLLRTAVGDIPAFDPQGPSLQFTYKNWKGETGRRTVVPDTLRFGSSEYHRTPQYLLRAFDVDKGAMREFAYGDISLP